MLTASEIDRRNSREKNLRRQIIPFSIAVTVIAVERRGSTRSFLCGCSRAIHSWSLDCIFLHRQELNSRPCHRPATIYPQLPHSRDRESLASRAREIVRIPTSWPRHRVLWSELEERGYQPPKQNSTAPSAKLNCPDLAPPDAQQPPTEPRIIFNPQAADSCPSSSLPQHINSCAGQAPYSPRDEFRAVQPDCFTQSQLVQSSTAELRSKYYSPTVSRVGMFAFVVDLSIWNPPACLGRGLVRLHPSQANVR